MKKLTYDQITKLPGYSEWLSKFEKSKKGCALFINHKTKEFSLEYVQRISNTNESIVVDKY